MSDEFDFDDFDDDELDQRAKTNQINKAVHGRKTKSSLKTERFHDSDSTVSEDTANMGSSAETETVASFQSRSKARWSTRGNHQASSRGWTRKQDSAFSRRFDVKSTGTTAKQPTEARDSISNRRSTSTKHKSKRTSTLTANEARSNDENALDCLAMSTGPSSVSSALKSRKRQSETSTLPFWPETRQRRTFGGSPTKRRRVENDPSESESSEEPEEEVGPISESQISELSMSQGFGDEVDELLSKTKSDESSKRSSPESRNGKSSTESVASTVAGAPSSKVSSVSTKTFSSLRSNQKRKVRYPRGRDRPSIFDGEDDVSSKQRRPRNQRPVKEVTSRQRLVGDVNKHAPSLRSIGDYQRLHDECVDLCNSLQKYRTTKSSERKMLLTTASELLQLLSSKSNRKILFFDGPVLRRGEDSPIAAILDLLGSFCDIFDSTDYGGQSPSRSVHLGKSVEYSSPPKSLFRDKLPHSPMFNNSPDPRSETQTPFFCRDRYFLQLLDAAGTLAYIIGLDCTMSGAGVADSCARTARSVRYEVMSHPHALHGILSLIRADPLVSTLRKMLFSDNENRIQLDSLSRRKDDDAVPRLEDVTGSPGIPKCRKVPDSSTEQSRSGSVSSRSTTSRQLSDPTRSGRNRRKRARTGKGSTLYPVLESAERRPLRLESDSLSFQSSEGRQRKFRPDLRSDDMSHDSELSVSSEAHVVEFQKALDKVSERVVASLPSSNVSNDFPQQHTCSRKFAVEYRITGETSHSVVLVALSRIIRGKVEWCEKSCLDVETRDDTVRDFGSIPSYREDVTVQHEDDVDDNLLLQTNVLLGKSGCLPSLSMALAETVVGILWLLEKRTRCKQCILYLHGRFSSLTSLVDEACLMNDENRELICREGYTTELGTFAVASLVTFLRVITKRKLVFAAKTSSSDQGWHEMTLDALKSLTSLTHENKFSAKELKSSIRNRFTRVLGDEDATGVEALGHVLHAAVVHGKSSGGQATQINKMRYDSIIFCLNTLVNCVESSEGSITEALADVWVDVKEDDGVGRGNKTSIGREHFLSWLVEWLVSETSCFHEAICAFGSEASAQAERRLEKHENEPLVISGNGFVLLAALLSHSGDLVLRSKHCNDLYGKTVQDVILSKLPGDDVLSKINYAKNLLRIFCNFYHVSIGDLSIAVVEPIKKLIQNLDDLALVVVPIRG